MGPRLNVVENVYVDAMGDCSNRVAASAAFFEVQ